MKISRLFLTIASITVITLIGCTKDSNSRDKKVRVESVSLNQKTLTLVVGGRETFTFSITPQDAANKEVSWSHMGDAVSVDRYGTVTAVKTGQANIIVTTDDGEKTDQCVVNVTPIVTTFTVTLQGRTIYSGTPETPSVIVTAFGKTLYHNDYTLAYSNNINAGTATVTATGRDDYAGSSGSEIFTIEKCPVVVTADDKFKFTGDADPTLTFTGSLYGSDTYSGALTREAGETVGAYDILQGTLSASDNYALTFKKGVFLIFYRP